MPQKITYQQSFARDMTLVTEQQPHLTMRMLSVKDVPPLSRTPLTVEGLAIGGNSGSARGSLVTLAGAERLLAIEGPVTRQGDAGGCTGRVGDAGGESVM